MDPVWLSPERWPDSEVATGDALDGQAFNVLEWCHQRGRTADAVDPRLIWGASNRRDIGRRCQFGTRRCGTWRLRRTRRQPTAAHLRGNLLRDEIDFLCTDLVLFLEGPEKQEAITQCVDSTGHAAC